MKGEGRAVHGALWEHVNAEYFVMGRKAFQLDPKKREKFKMTQENFTLESDNGKINFIYGCNFDELPDIIGSVSITEL